MDKLGGKLMLEFVGIRSKVYAYRTSDDNELKKVKGITRTSLRQITFKNYLDCLTEHTKFYSNQVLIKSKLHSLARVTTNKLVLQPYDDKRNINYFTNDLVPWGYVRTVSEVLFIIFEKVRDNNVGGINYVATKIFIPQSRLAYEILRNSTNEVIEIIYDAAEEMDRLASQVLQQLPQDVIEMDIIKSIVTQLTGLTKFTDINYTTYAVLNLFQGCSKQTYSISNFLGSYKNKHFYINKLMCDAAYFADPNFLSKCFLARGKKNYDFKFQRGSRSSHQDIMVWIMKNIAKKEAGWKEGPDSGLWPSNNPNDYIEILKIIKLHVQFNL
ncbi:hypothetical protein QE152_g7158 [Popillia japonica]|uniref:Uncharacterized protein n=1 Tax=Popillia japonica TaxID=7064 RepID=A0AAW1MC31_POPJA